MSKKQKKRCLIMGLSVLVISIGVNEEGKNIMSKGRSTDSGKS